MPGGCGLPDGPLDKAGKCKAIGINSSDSGVYWNLAIRSRRRGHSKEVGPRLCLHRQRVPPLKALRLYPQHPRENKPRSWQLRSAQVGAAYAMVVTGRPVESVIAAVDSSARLSTKNVASPKSKGGSDVMASRGSS